jgi:hypothetical protein
VDEVTEGPAIYIGRNTTNWQVDCGDVCGAGWDWDGMGWTHVGGWKLAPTNRAVVCIPCRATSGKKAMTESHPLVCFMAF